MNNDKYNSIDIEISSVCNMTCINCEYSAGGKAKKGYMSIDVFQNILDVAKEHEVKYVHLVGLGEQTLHPKFNELASLLIDYKNEFNIGITTNGTRIKDYYNILNEFDTVTISIDAANRVTYDNVRPGHNFDILLNDIDLIKTKKKRASFIINSQNISEVEHFIKLIMDKNFNEVYFEVANEPWLKQSNENLISESKYLLDNYNHNDGFKVIFKEPSKINVCDYFDNIIKITYDNKLSICPFISLSFEYISLKEILAIKKIEKEKISNGEYSECLTCNHYCNNKNYNNKDK